VYDVQEAAALEEAAVVEVQYSVVEHRIRCCTWPLPAPVLARVFGVKTAQDEDIDWEEDLQDER
jgi:hypothetical protein